MSSEATPIAPARFAEALKELPASSLALKVLELRNSIAHLDYSNSELKPYAEGRATALDAGAATLGAGAPDQDCIDAIKENEAVIERMQERIQLIKAEVEERGLSWAEFQGKPDEEVEKEENQEQPAESTSGPNLSNGVNGHAPPTQNGQSQQHPAWTDGTFTTGTIGGLGDEELLRRLQERLPELQDDEDDPEGGMHL
ncbi:hypothetical protein BX600DRAFT_432691 [Xylariales sp. PMI_506]|nr:hypothetical protein BX600DRAFT_432691 [Xylariales sp. PMI_506]